MKPVIRTHSQNPWMRAWRQLLRDKRSMMSLVLISLISLAAILAPLISPYDPNGQDPAHLVRSPSSEFVFGTDSLGRDLFSRVLAGSRVSMSVALVTALSGLLLGSIYGAVSGICGGWVDKFLMRILDLLYTIPTLLLMIFLNVLVGRGLVGILVALSLESLCTVARLVRGQVMQLLNAEYITAARALGASSGSLWFKHLFPNLIAPLLVALTFLIPSNIMYEAFLSFVGLGVQPPLSSWGTLSNEGWRGLMSHPHLILFPGAAIFVTMLAFNFLGDGLSDALNPKGAAA